MIDKIKAALNKAKLLVEVAYDWNLNEIEIDGEMVRTSTLMSEFDEALAALRTPAQPVGLDAPDGPGWWAWTDGNNQGVSEVYRCYDDLYILDDEPGGLTANHFPGRKWYPLNMPWEPQPPAGWEPVGDSHFQESINRPIELGGRLIVDLQVKRSGRLIEINDSDGNKVAWLFNNNYAIMRRVDNGGSSGK